MYGIDALRIVDLGCNVCLVEVEGWGWKWFCYRGLGRENVPASEKDEPLRNKGARLASVLYHFEITDAYGVLMGCLVSSVALARTFSRL